MKVLARYVAVWLIIGCCHAFRTTRTLTARFSKRIDKTRHNRQRYSLSKCSRTDMMSYWQHHDPVALADALGQATQILVDATDASRGGAVVEQIPYVPSDTSGIPDFPKIVLGSAACLAAYAWAAYEFGQRIVTQRACEVCGGSGLVSNTRSGTELKQPRKCYACGGFLPWENWGKFWQSNMDVGNGGVLQRPASDYDELNKVARAAKCQGSGSTPDDQQIP